MSRNELLSLILLCCAGAKLPCAVLGAYGADEQANDGQAPGQHHIQVHQDPAAF